MRTREEKLGTLVPLVMGLGMYGLVIVGLLALATGNGTALEIVLR